jgi:hypothetical protein
VLTSYTGRVTLVLLVAEIRTFLLCIRPRLVVGVPMPHIQHVRSSLVAVKRPKPETT